MPVPLLMPCCDTQSEGHEARWIRCCRNPCKSSPLGGLESLKLSPFEKWKRYGMPPWKCIMSLMLVVLTTCQIWSLNTYLIPYTRSAKQNWQVYLVEPDIYAYPHGFGDELTFHIFEISTLVNQVAYSVKQYYRVENKTVGNFIIPKFSSGKVKPPLLTVYIFVDDEGNEEEKQMYNLTVDDLGPFSEKNGTELSDYIHTTNYFMIDFSVVNVLDYGLSNDHDSCYWNGVNQLYSFTWRGRIDLTVNPTLKICEEEFHKHWYDRDVGVNIIMIMLILVAATISQVLLIKSIYKQMKLFRRQERERNIKQSVNYLKWQHWLDFMNLWFFISTTANIFNFIAAGLCLNMFLGVGDSSWKVPLAFTGMACAFSWFAVVQFFEHFPKYYSLILTLRISAPKVMRFVIGASPVFIGFAMFGVAMFSSYSELFKDVGAASVTLFALLNGDVIHDVYNALLPAGSLISRGYLYIFISTFIYAVLNIFIAIVEDSYFNAKRRVRLKLARSTSEGSKAQEGQDVYALSLGHAMPKHMKDHMGQDNSIAQIAREDSTLDTYALQQFSAMTLYSKPEEISAGDLKEPLLKSTFSFTNFKSPPPPSNRVPRKRAQKRRELMEILGGMQNAMKENFQKRILSIVSNSGIPVRPPHDPDYFPCDFNDCIYCILKQVYKESLKSIETSIQEKVKDLSQ